MGSTLARDVLANLARVPGLEIHLIVSDGAKTVLKAENELTFDDLTRYAYTVYDAGNMAASPSNGSWRHSGMVICPCSMSSLAYIATGAGRNLIHRAADVTLKERLPLVIVARETPLSRIHLRNMLSLSESGAVIMPFSPSFYPRKATFSHLAAHFAGRILDQLGIENTLCCRWHQNAFSGGETLLETP